jgi:hypothetical protein
MKVCAGGEQTIWAVPEEAPWMGNKETCLVVRKLRLCLIDSKKGGVLIMKESKKAWRQPRKRQLMS